jgi:ubiquinone/menaquinone biosynthesis C-methylase UbiE
MDNEIYQKRRTPRTAQQCSFSSGVPIPGYLQRIYWWTYIHPLAVWAFDRQWVVNLLLLTQYNRLRRKTLEAAGRSLSGATLLVSCPYGDLVPLLVERVVNGRGFLDIIDVLPIQLRNVRAKLPSGAPVRLLNMNADHLDLPSNHYDLVVSYFLLHEVPANVRSAILKEALRVLKPGGRFVVAEFAMPKWWNPFRYLWAVFLSIFEPFALDMWRIDFADMLPETARGYRLEQCRYFGGLFQRSVVVKSEEKFFSQS